MTTKARLFAKFERVFEPLTTDDIIQALCNFYSASQLEEFLDYCQDEYGVNNSTNTENDDE